jgi:hypothetical protein
MGAQTSWVPEDLPLPVYWNTGRTLIQKINERSSSSSIVLKIGLNTL